LVSYTDKQNQWQQNNFALLVSKAESQQIKQAIFTSVNAMCTCS
jgi:hypothetical protein